MNNIDGIMLGLTHNLEIRISQLLTKQNFGTFRET